MGDVIVIGGGASGIVAAIFSKRKNNRVLVLERNASPLKKLLMTGNGKCNYLNEVYGTSFYHSEDKDLIGSFLLDSNITSVRNFFLSLGIVPKIKNGYYYPFSNQATSIKNALLFEAKERGVEIACNSFVEEVWKENDVFYVKTLENIFSCEKLVFSTGGASYSKTGSDGLGYSFLEKFGHTIVPTLPALVPLISNHPYLKEWDGVRTDVEIELFENGEYLTRESGEIQLTSYGVSGICVFQLSHYVSRGLSSHKEEELHINFVPFMEKLPSIWMDEYSRLHPSKTVLELLEGVLSYKLVVFLLKSSSISKESFYQDLSKEKKLLLCKYLRSFPLKITGTKSFDFAQVTSGGVKLSEVNLSTMESKKVKGLYVTGELLDLQGNCGGYNLTACWISGMLAGKDIGGYYD